MIKLLQNLTITLIDFNTPKQQDYFHLTGLCHKVTKHSTLYILLIKYKHKNHKTKL